MREVIKKIFKERWIIFCVVLLTLMTGVVYWLYPKKNVGKKEKPIFVNDGFVRKGAGCDMPVLDPFSPEVMKMEKNMSKVECTGIDWVQCHKSECFVVPKILEEYRSIKCTYRDILFKTDFKTKLGKPTVVHDRYKYILKNSDYVQVSCKGMHIFSLGLFYSRWLGHVGDYRRSSARATVGFNILLLAFDSASHHGFIRRMQRSYHVLRDDLDAVFMESYNVVGDGTLAAAFPILTGKTEAEQPDARKGVTNATFDLSYFLFSVLKDKGYRTAYHEDYVKGGTFQYRCNGFGEPPTDHYMRILLLEQRNHMKRNPLYSLYAKKWDKFCFGAVPQHLLMLNHTAQFFDLDGSKFCLTFFGDICHDSFNEISVADDDLAEFLMKFKTDGHLENTAVFVMGDHGPRISKKRAMYQGRMEERLPLVALILPEKLKRERPDALSNLINNSIHLTSPFDIHTTILDIVGLHELRSNQKVNDTNLERGMSFLRPIPKTRTCLEADIAPYWCACTKWYNVSVSDPMFVRVGRALADYIDNITQAKRALCAKRSLISTEYVIVRGSNKRKTGDFLKNATRVRLSNEYYLTQISMAPGTALYEGAVEYILKEDRYIISEKQISRINLYGDEPSCVSATQPHLNKYCYCKNGLIDNLPT